jgi:hypothetical protein
VKEMFVLAALIYLFSSQVIAMPAVGDYAWFDTYRPFKGYLTLEITKDLPKEKKLETVVKSYDHILGGYSKVTVEEVKTFKSTSDITNLFKNCNGAGKSLVDVKVPAGVFKACRVDFEDLTKRGSNWYGCVPFGLIKTQFMIIENGITITNNLREYEFGEETICQ